MGDEWQRANKRKTRAVGPRMADEWQGTAANEIYGVLDFPCGVERLPNGNTLVADAGDETQRSSEILEVDPFGQIVWFYATDLRFPHNTHLRANGNILVSDTTNNRVIEITRDKDIVLDSDRWGGGTGTLSDGSHLDYPNDVHETGDGHLLITDRNNNRCVSVDRDGSVLWQYGKDLKHPHNADPLPNGNVIIADSDQNRVIEVSRGGKIVWSYGEEEGDLKLNWPRDADRLESGNTLVCDSKNSRVIEVGPLREVVWEYRLPYFANFYEADALENGNVLIADQQHQRVIEIDRFGNVIWQFRNYRFASPIHCRLTNGFFKSRDDEGIPEGWSLFTRTAEGGGELLWSADEKGQPYVGLQFDRRGGLCLMQAVAVRPGRTYKAGAMLRADALQPPASACLQLAFRDAYGGLYEDVFGSPKGELLSGSTDWVHTAIEGEAPETATSAVVRVLITGRGRVWIRHVMMGEA